MGSFRNKETRLLVATDLAGRGLDIEDISHIINYDIPIYPLTYFHRIGRTARAGKTGKSITFVTPQEQLDLDQIRSFTNTSIRPLELRPEAPGAASPETISNSSLENREYDVAIGDISRREKGVDRISGSALSVPQANPGYRIRARVPTARKNLARALIQDSSAHADEGDEEMSRPWFYRKIRRIGG